MKTAVVILNYNNYEDTINCINSVEKYNSSDITYFIVDNGSTRITAVEELNRFFNNCFPNDYVMIEYQEKLTKLKRINFLVSYNNDGYANGNNKALNYIFEQDDIDNILILNNDVLFVDDIIPELERNLYLLDSCAIVSPILYHKDMANIDYNCARLNHSKRGLLLTHILLKRNILGYLDRETSSRQILRTNPDYLKLPFFEIEMPSGSCMLLKKDLFQLIGGFDPNTFLYYEENILHKKIQSLGLKNYLIPSLKCIHLGGMSTKSSPSAFVKNKSLESALYYATTYAGYNVVQKVIFKYAVSLLKFIVKIKNTK